MFEWDEAKRLGNLAKHRLDFVRADLPFDGRAWLDLPSTHAPEPRMITVAELDGVFVALVWTWRGDRRRAISLRRARHEERAAYRQLYG